MRKKNKLIGIPLKEKKKGKRNLGLLERIHNFGTEISLKRRNENDRSSTVRE